MSYLIVTEKIGTMPNQATGTVCGKPFYFRARHGGWCLRVAEPGSDPVTAGEIVLHGEDPQAGWWEEDEARTRLELMLMAIERGSPA